MDPYAGYARVTSAKNNEVIIPGKLCHPIISARETPKKNQPPFAIMPELSNFRKDIKSTHSDDYKAWQFSCGLYCGAPLSPDIDMFGLPRDPGRPITARGDSSIRCVTFDKRRLYALNAKKPLTKLGIQHPKDAEEIYEEERARQRRIGPPKFEIYLGNDPERIREERESRRRKEQGLDCCKEDRPTKLKYGWFGPRPRKDEKQLYMIYNSQDGVEHPIYQKYLNQLQGNASNDCKNQYCPNNPCARLAETCPCSQRCKGNLSFPHGAQKHIPDQPCPDQTQRPISEPVNSSQFALPNQKARKCSTCPQQPQSQNRKLVRRPYTSECTSQYPIPRSTGCIASNNELNFHLQNPCRVEANACSCPEQVSIASNNQQESDDSTYCSDLSQSGSQCRKPCFEGNIEESKSTGKSYDIDGQKLDTYIVSPPRKDPAKLISCDYLKDLPPFYEEQANKCFTNFPVQPFLTMDGKQDAEDLKRRKEMWRQAAGIREDQIQECSNKFEKSGKSEDDERFFKHVICRIKDCQLEPNKTTKDTEKNADQLYTNNCMQEPKATTCGTAEMKKISNSSKSVEKDCICNQAGGDQSEEQTENLALPSQFKPWECKKRAIEGYFNKNTDQVCCPKPTITCLPCNPLKLRSYECLKPPCGCCKTCQVQWVYESRSCKMKKNLDNVYIVRRLKLTDEEKTQLCYDDIELENCPPLSKKDKCGSLEETQAVPSNRTKVLVAKMEREKKCADLNETAVKVSPCAQNCRPGSTDQILQTAGNSCGSYPKTESRQWQTCATTGGGSLCGKPKTKCIPMELNESCGKTGTNSDRMQIRIATAQQDPGDCNYIDCSEPVNTKSTCSTGPRGACRKEEPDKKYDIFGTVMKKKCRTNEITVDLRKKGKRSSAEPKNNQSKCMDDDELEKNAPQCVTLKPNYNYKVMMTN